MPPEGPSHLIDEHARLLAAVPPGGMSEQIAAGDDQLGAAQASPREAVQPVAPERLHLATVAGVRGDPAVFCQAVMKNGRKSGAGTDRTSWRLRVVPDDRS